MFFIPARFGPSFVGLSLIPLMPVLFDEPIEHGCCPHIRPHTILTFRSSLVSKLLQAWSTSSINMRAHRGTRGLKLSVRRGLRGEGTRKGSSVAKLIKSSFFGACAETGREKWLVHEIMSV